MRQATDLKTIILPRPLIENHWLRRFRAARCGRAAARHARARINHARDLCAGLQKIAGASPPMGVCSHTHTGLLGHLAPRSDLFIELGVREMAAGGRGRG